MNCSVQPSRLEALHLNFSCIYSTYVSLLYVQIIVWYVIPAIKYSGAEHNNNILVLIVLAQYLPRLYLIFPLTYEIVKATGVVAKTAWEGAVYNLLLYLIASHVRYLYAFVCNLSSFHMLKFSKFQVKCIAQVFILFFLCSKFLRILVLRSGSRCTMVLAVC